ncbi:MATE family multidrug resistance protein [Oikeobacillus pervagus]|uniref:Probable multidrug resistance protein NorM n=1 Tax=Oikeobacillus pervagus TaxID=1325931 RepID=A0AAJ1T0E9_9BACI|nr:MATE family efflux transporter [Oikeobacillus pervagus]MDQ0214406.1 MATE family multidrug resistance protein [Oikeobacillus pervagus]
MKQTWNKKEKLQQFLVIFIPIFITQIGMYSMNFFDTMMSGQFSPNDLAGVAIGSSLWVPIFTGLSGILLSITPIVAQLIGANNKKEVPFSVIQGLYAAITLASFVLIIGGFVLEPILSRMNLEPTVHMIAKNYLIALSFGMIPLFMYTVLRSFIDALGMTRTSMMITLLTLPINFVLNYLLIFGKFGFPRLGGVGAGYASAMTYWFITIIAIFVIYRNRPFSNFHVFRTFYLPSFKKWKEIFTIGVPIGLSIFFETSIFSAVTLLMSEYSTTVIASHQAALNFSSLLYMLPLSISMSLTIVVGHEVGAKRFNDAIEYSWLGVSIAIVFSSILGILLFIFRESIAMIYTDQQEVVHLTAQFLMFAVFFQLSDAIQAPVQGALRGYKDVNVTFVMAMVSYWIIGLPLGIILARTTSMAAFGYWIGLIVGLAAGAVTLSLRLFYIQRKKYQALKA